MSFLDNINPPGFFFIYGITITKAHISMGLVIMLIIALFIILPEISAPYQWLRRKYYLFITELVEANIGHEGAHISPLIGTIFSTILFGNLLGMIPGTFPCTCDLTLNLTMSTTVIFGTVIVAVLHRGIGALGLFCPSGVPIPIRPFLFAIETPLFFLRILTLAGRLFLNISSGHLVLACVLGLIEKIPFMLPMYFFMIAMELLSCCIQAYVFTILSTIYFGDGFHEH